MCEPLSHCTNQSSNCTATKIIFILINYHMMHYRWKQPFKYILSHFQAGHIMIINKTTLALHAVINQLPLNITFPSEDTQKHQVIFSSGVNDLMLILKLATINALTPGAGLYTFSFSYQLSFLCSCWHTQL